MAVDWAQFVTPFLLPISFLMDLFTYWGILWRYYTSAGKETHHDRVAEVQRQVKLWRTEGHGRKMCTARPSYMSITQQKLGYKDKMYRISVNLYDVLEVDTKNMTVRVEPLVTIGFLNRLLVSQGYTLPIVPELDMLTISGLIMGGGLESTSHKYGMFHHICTEYELVTADGDCLLVNEENNYDLFHTIPMSYGTLGFLTSITIKIIPFKPYIKLTYRPTYSLQAFTDLLDKETHKQTDNDSVEGILYSKDTAVVMTGIFVTEKEVDWSKTNRMGLWYKQWFYKHVETMLDKKEETVEYVPTLHFHQRHNKPMFWLTPIFLPWAHTFLARLLTGWLLPINTQLLKLLKETFIGDETDEDFVLQDFMIPIYNIGKTIDISEKMTGVWPMWAVPARLYQDNVPKEMLPRSGDIMYIDIGVYGRVKTKDYMGRDKTIKAFEKFTLEHGGYQALYAETLMTYEEFCEMFARVQYDKVRDSLPLCKEGFPEVYEKVSREGRRGNWKPSSFK